MTGEGRSDLPADLLGLVAKLRAVRAEMQLLADAPEWDDLLPVWRDLEAGIAATPAKTHEDLTLKQLALEPDRDLVSPALLDSIAADARVLTA